MRVERIDALFRGALHDDAPAALERFLQERRQHAFQLLALQVVEEKFGHQVHRMVANAPRASPPAIDTVDAAARTDEALGGYLDELCFLLIDLPCNLGRQDVRCGRAIQYGDEDIGQLSAVELTEA